MQNKKKKLSQKHRSPRSKLKNCMSELQIDRQNVTKNIVTNVIEVSDSRSTDSDDDYIKMLHDYYVMKLLPNKLNLL